MIRMFTSKITGLMQMVTRNDNNLINESDKLFITVLLLQIKKNKNMILNWHNN
jgi:hypothetical protein